MASEPMSGVKVEAPNVKVEMPDRDATSHTISCDPSTLKDELLQAIEGIQIAGTFASSAPVSPLSPGVFVHGVGEVAAPLTEFQACQLIAQARQAPYGKGSETIVDTAVRNTWELDPGQFELRHPRFPGQVQTLCKHVAKTLGINGTIKAELYKMLIYEKGAMFKAHTDTEKIPGMFGTLVISLPSTHQGGDVVLRHCGKQHVFRSSAHVQSCAFWYSDVSHEVLPVTSGYRWVLTYNLALDPARPRPSASLLGQVNTLPLKYALNRWLGKSPTTRQNKYFYHILDHDYTEASISLNGLKAQDLVRVQALKEECSKLPVDVYLALLEKMESGSVEDDYDLYDMRYCDEEDEEDEEDEDGYHEIDEVLQYSHNVLTLVDLDGHTVTKDLQLEEEDILQEDPFADIQGREHYEGYMGTNSHTLAVVIVPHDSLSDLFTGYSKAPSPVTHLARRCMLPQAQPSLFTALEAILRRAWTPTGRPGVMSPIYRPSLDSAAVQEVVKLALQRERYDMFDEALAKSPETVEPGLLEWLNSAVALSSHLSGQSEAITKLVPIPDQLSSIEPAALDWARQKARRCLAASASVKHPSGRDGRPMVDLAFYFDDPSAFLSETVVPIVAKRKGVLAFSLGFLSQLMDKTNSGKLPLESSLRMYRSIAKSLITDTHFENVKSHGTLKESAKRQYLDSPLEPLRRDLSMGSSHRELGSFFSGLIKADTGTDNLVTSFLLKLTANVPKISNTELHHLWVPFLRKITTTLDCSTMSPSELSHYQQLFTTFLKAYLERYVCREPVYNGNFVRPLVSCNCIDCERLNEFLADPACEVGRFAVNKQRRGHLHRKLQGAKIDCTHETERVGSPQTLVVTKTFRMVAAWLQTWMARRTEATKQLVHFDQNKLKKLLGDEYTAIINMDCILSAETKARQPLAETGQASSLRGPVVRAKRKLPEDIDVIDLTGE
ncbi:hypothetical protein LRP88_05951 [Fusarium phalaenopsidis]